MKIIMLVAALCAPGSSLFTATAPSAGVCEQPASAEPNMCSDAGRSCSVDRNCCSGTCSKGTCK